MSYYINKLVALLASPIGSTLLLLALLFAALLRSRQAGANRRRLRIAVLLMTAFAFAWLWFWSTSCAVRIVAQPLDDCESVDIADLPKADVVVVLGGSMAYNEYADAPEMYASADRVWHGARVFKAGKAGKVVLTGEGSYACSVPLLMDFGVPQSEIVAFEEPRNTEEEARRIKEEFGDDAKIVLVTSAWHMRRSLLLFRRAGLDVIPSAADREMSLRRGVPLEFKEFLPEANSLMRNSYAVKEWVAYYGYKWLRGSMGSSSCRRE